MLKLSRILCPTDFSEPSYAGLVAACTLARICGAELILLHVTEPFVGFGDLLSDEVGGDCDLATAKAKLAEVIETRVPSGVQARAMVKWGGAADAIVQVAQNEDVDLVVIATHGLTGWRHMLFGSVTEAVVHGAHCPVLTVPIKPETGELADDEEEKIAPPVPLV